MLNKAERELLDDLDKMDGFPLLRKLMDPEEIKAANSLVKKGLVTKGRSDDSKATVQFYIAER